MLWLTAALASYDTDLAALESTRLHLGTLERTDARTRARRLLTDRFRDALIPAWFGTPWAFYGTSTVPKQGSIACGYFVSTVLQQAGFHVERVHMAQQPSEYIVKTFAPESSLKRFRTGSSALVVSWLRTQADGVYTVGLDLHTGFVVKRGTQVEFCHSSYLSQPAEVQCNDALTDPAFVSRYHIVGPVFTDGVLDAWLDGQPLKTYRP